MLRKVKALKFEQEKSADGAGERAESILTIGNLLELQQKTPM
jgi:hypothetical protein